MSKKKKSTSVDVDKIELAKQKRLNSFLSKNKETKQVDNKKEDFRKFFAKLKSKNNLDASLEAVIWLHFKDYNFDTKDKFEQGLKHFGL